MGVDGPEPSIPDKLFFKIGEVAQLTGTKPHVLRYWESEFKMLRPAKGDSGQRVYRKKDIELVFSIKRLLYEENFTIAGAKKKLQKQRAARADVTNDAGISGGSREVPEVAPPLPFDAKGDGVDVTRLRTELKEILDILNKN